MLITWSEGRPSRGFFLILFLAWLGGKMLELIFPATLVWHWHFARLMVMLVAASWAWQRLDHWFFPLSATTLLLSLETLFQVNEPGVFAYGNWIFSLALVLVAWLTAKSFWGTLAAFSGSVLLNQALVRFAYEGIVRYMDLPDPFIWNFGVVFFSGWAGLCWGWQTFKVRAGQKRNKEQLLSGDNIAEAIFPEQKGEGEL